MEGRIPTRIRLQRRWAVIREFYNFSSLILSLLFKAFLPLVIPSLLARFS
jgi:hypothetical protein